MDTGLTPTSQSAHKRSAIWLAALAGTVMAIGVVAVWYVLDERAREHIDSVTEYASRITQLQIRHDIDMRFSALERLAQRWTAAGSTPRPVWESDVQRYIADMPGFQAIEWADATLHVRWIVPEEGNEAAQGLDITKTEATRIAVIAA